MKKALFLVIIMMLALGMLFAGCTDDAATTDDVTTDDVTTDDATTDDAEATAGWTITVGDVAITDVDAAELEEVTQTLQKQDKEGNLKEQECTGYTLASLLEKAGVADVTTVTVTAADGYAYDLASDVALLETTMIVTVQDGETYETPRLAVEGEGSKAWVKDVATITAE